MRRILVVDDNVVDLVLVEHALADTYDVATVQTAGEVITWLEEHTTDMIIMDAGQESASSIETVKTIKSNARWSRVPILFLIEEANLRLEEECLQAGADDFIVKPFSPAIMKSRVGRSMELYGFRYGMGEELVKKAKQVEMVTMFSIMSIANTIDARDRYTKGHSVRVSRCAVDIARKLGWSEDELRNIQYVGLLHDIGKIGVPDAILNKPSTLTEEEFAVVQKHTVVGGEILKEIHTIPHVREGALYHHERYDGKGYPTGMKGTEIPLYARIICIADAYDAMSTDRVYRPLRTREETIREYERCRGTQFDPELTDIFIGMLKDGYVVDENTVQKESVSAGNELLDSILKECMDEAANISMIDSLTGLYNKAYAQSHVEELLMSGRSGALFMMDLDDFKHINDVYGHIVGDQILKNYAKVMRKVATGSDILCRVGGDEFIMFNTDMDSREAAEERAKEIIRAMAEEAQEINMTTEVFASMGIAFSNPGEDFITLYKKADKALYFTKRYGKNSYHFFEDEDEEDEDSANNVDISNIRDIIQGRMDFSSGAFNLAYGEFQKVYNFIVRYIERGEQSVQIVLMTVKKSGVGLPDIAGQEEVMSGLEKAIASSLRASDVFTRYSSSQYIVILMDVSEENGKMVTGRIMDKFDKLNTNDAYMIQSELCRLD